MAASHYDPSSNFAPRMPQSQYGPAPQFVLESAFPRSFVPQSLHNFHLPGFQGQHIQAGAELPSYAPQGQQRYRHDEPYIPANYGGLSLAGTAPPPPPHPHRGAPRPAGYARPLPPDARRELGQLLLEAMDAERRAVPVNPPAHPQWSRALYSPVLAQRRANAFPAATVPRQRRHSVAVTPSARMRTRVPPPPPSLSTDTFSDDTRSSFTIQTPSSFVSGPEGLFDLLDTPSPTERRRRRASMIPVTHRRHHHARRVHDTSITGPALVAPVPVTASTHSVLDSGYGGENVAPGSLGLDIRPRKLFVSQFDTPSNHRTRHVMNATPLPEPPTSRSSDRLRKLAPAPIKLPPPEQGCNLPTPSSVRHTSCLGENAQAPPPSHQPQHTTCCKHAADHAPADEEHRTKQFSEAPAPAVHVVSPSAETPSSASTIALLQRPYDARLLGASRIYAPGDVQRALATPPAPLTQAIPLPPVTARTPWFEQEMMRQRRVALEPSSSMCADVGSPVGAKGEPLRENARKGSGDSEAELSKVPNGQRHALGKGDALPGASTKTKNQDTQREEPTVVNEREGDALSPLDILFAQAPFADWERMTGKCLEAVKDMQFVCISPPSCAIECRTSS